MQQKHSPLSPAHWISQIGSFKVQRPRAADLLPLLKNSRIELLLAGVFIAFLALVQFAVPDMPDNDGFYHIKLAHLMRIEGLKPEFTWLPLSILNPREFYDHHFLFHVALIPFTFGDLRVGAKLAVVVFAALAFLSTWYVLKNQRIPFSILWAFGLMAVSEAFIYRMSITRAQSLSLFVLMLALDWLLRRKIYRLGVLAFLYVWLYDAFPLLFIFALIYTSAAWLLEHKLDPRALLAVGFGTGLGLLINPYFPHNIVFAVQHILPKLFETTAVSVGNEWFPYTTAQLLQNSPLALAAFFSGALALGLNQKRIDLRTLTVFLITGLFGLMLLQSRRFIEYFPPFALLFAAFAWAPVISNISFHIRVPARLSRLLGLSQLSFNLAVVILILAIIPGIRMTLTAARASLATSKPFQTYAGASAWLTANTPAGSRVFQTDWDDFPRLFFYNTHNTYLIGLDPTYMSLYDGEMYDLWVAITQGDVDKPSSLIASNFGSSYVLTDLRHKDFLKQASADTGLRETYRDDDAVVFEVLP